MTHLGDLLMCPRGRQCTSVDLTDRNNTLVRVLDNAMTGERHSFPRERVLVAGSELRVMASGRVAPHPDSLVAGTTYLKRSDASTQARTRAMADPTEGKGMRSGGKANKDAAIEALGTSICRGLDCEGLHTHTHGHSGVEGTDGRRRGEDRRVSTSPKSPSCPS